MTEEAGLLDAILADPDDDTPRLVYADWLDEHGEEPSRARAEFIRAGCELARLPPRDRRAENLTARCRQLQAQYDEAWTGPLRVACDNEFSFTYSRGFVSQVIANGRGLTSGFAAVAALSPITSLVIDDAYNLVHQDDLGSLARRPELRRLREIDMRHLDPGAITTLLVSPFLSGMEALRVLAVDVRGVAQVVVSCGLAGRLRLLALWSRSGQRLTLSGGLRALMSQDWPVLTHCRLEACDLNGDEVRALARSLRAPRLRMFHLGRNALQPPALTAVLERPPGPSAVSFTRGGSGPADGWVDAPPGPAKLHLSGFTNGPALLVALMQSRPRLLDALELIGIGLTAADARALANWPGLAGVKEVSLVANPLGDESAAALAASPHLDAVQMLWIRDTSLTKAGKQALKKRFGRRVRVT